MAVPEFNAVVAQRVEVASGLAILRIVPRGWDLPPFKAGQYTVLGLPGSAARVAMSDPEEPPAPADKMIRRAYSIASSSVEGQYVEFYVTLVRSGALTPRLFALAPGSPVWLSPKIVGMFTLDQVPDGRNVVLVATGTGIAPYMSMLRTHLARIREPRVAVVHGARHTWDLGYRAELETMQRLCPNFRYAPVVSSPEEESLPWVGRRGFVNEHWLPGRLEGLVGFEPEPSSTHAFLCGNPLMIEAMLPLLESQGFTEHTPHRPGNIHLEKYW
jgi:ferredoxin--NADP+ reductase